MNADRPLRRHDALVQLSREHHQGLLLCWKIKQGFSKNVEPDRMKQYADWFYREHLIPHFAEEENALFPILGNDNALVEQAVAEHRQLETLFTQTENTEQTLREISELLDKHIRFEERVLFEEIQKAATEEQLQAIARHNEPTPFCDNESDAFWK